MTLIVENIFFFFHSKTAENTNTNTDRLLLKIYSNKLFQINRSNKQLGPVSLKPLIKAIQALQKSETLKKKIERKKKDMYKFSL